MWGWERALLETDMILDILLIILVALVGAYATHWATTHPLDRITPTDMLRWVRRKLNI